MNEGLISLYPRFTFGWALLLLLLVPWTIWMGCRLRSLPPGRKWTAIVLRTLVLVCLIAALAGTQLVKETDRLAVFFLLDRSNSIPEELRLASTQAVRNVSQEHQTGKDEAGVIAFGELPRIELSMGPSLELREIRSFVGGEQTDLAAAMRLAMAAFPQGYMRRMVIYSDGNETRGSALEEARMAQAAGIAVDVVPLTIGGAHEVLVREVTAPNSVNTGEPFRLRAVVHAKQECEATLKVYQRLQHGKRILAPRRVILHEGDNVFLLSQELFSPGFYEYEVAIESDADTVVANNEGHAFTMVRGEPTVLYVESNPGKSVYLKSALEAEGLLVEQRTPASMPVSLAELQRYDALVLSDVSSTDLSAEQLKALEAAVRDLGIGLVMIGGPSSFGAGGFIDTPVEAALPVDMDIKQRKVLPRGALVLIMHTCEIPDGNAWAREIGLASLNVLASQDLMGALGYLYQVGPMESGESWIFPLQPVGDKTMMRATLITASSAIGDMPAVGPTLQMAYTALKGADAAVKRVVIISDGDPAAPTKGLLGRLKEAGISVSTVCIAPHSPNDQNMLRWIALETGGQFYFVTTPQNLPQIFTKEAAAVKRGMLVEEPFVPVLNHDSELLSGLSGAPLPQLKGYVVTSPKNKAVVPLVSHEGDPVLAHWRYGLGKSVAFTSDITTRWAGDWLGWQGFNQFWAQTVRWAMRETTPTNFRVDTKVKEGKGYVKIDAVDHQGRFVNFLRPRAVVVGPAPEFTTYTLELSQTGPGIYETSFPVNHRGSYMINITYETETGSQAMIPAGLALSYSREYDFNNTNLPLLEQITDASGGKVVSATDNPFRHDLKSSPTITPIWHYLALLAALLFPVDIFVRRVAIDYAAAYARALTLLKNAPGLGRMIAAPTPKPTPVTGRYGAARSPESATDPDAVARSFGIAPAAAASRQPGEGREYVEMEETAEETDYTKRLLAAKQRARDKQKRRSGRDEPEEES